MSNPPLVEVWRGGLLESQHRGAYAVLDACGKVIASAGAIDQVIFPRSAYKTLQAIPLLETGAAAAFDVTDAELSLACASHIGARGHVTTARGWLARLGVDPHALECGAHEPADPAERRRLARRRQQPGPEHNNCSGKHTGFLTLAMHLGFDQRGYTRFDHPLQGLVTSTISELCDVAPGQFPVAIDGCSAPNLGMPLKAFALALARASDGRGLSEARRAALTRLFGAQLAVPENVAGEGMLDTELIAAGQGRVFAKRGAEGVHAAFLPELGFGVAVKIDDGAERASGSALCAILVRLGVLDESWPAVRRYHAPVLRNWRGLEVGRLRPHSASFDWSFTGS